VLGRPQQVQVQVLALVLALVLPLVLPLVVASALLLAHQWT
jgi:hypothetical protein